MPAGGKKAGYIPGNPDEKANHENGTELFNYKKGLSVDTPEYNEAKNIWYILGILAFMLDPTIDGDKTVLDEVGGLANPEQSIANCVKNLKNADPARKKTLARQCRNLHRQICGHCACR